MVQAQGSAPVTIVLLPEVVVDDTLVTLEQVAKLSGGPDFLRQRLGKLDVAEFKLGAAYATVSAQQVGFRILLAGVDESQVALRGAQRTLIVESQEPATLRKILTSAEQTLRAQCAGGAADLNLAPHRGVNVPVIELRAGERVRFQAKVKAPLPRAGRVLVDVALTVNGKVREVVPVFFEVAELETPARSAVQERSAIRPAGYSAPLAGRDILVKARDNVKLIANVGTARLEALGEALQDGRVGEVIRVRNVESSRVIHGRVQPSGMVLVEY